jgi:hypothetical protein
VMENFIGLSLVNLETILTGKSQKRQVGVTKSMT